MAYSEGADRPSRDFCFWEEALSLSWSDAKDHCSGHGAELAWVEDGQDFTDVMYGR